MQLRLKNVLIRKTVSACTIVIALVAAIVVAPVKANAEDLRSVSCSVDVEFLFNDLRRAFYQRDFVVSPGVDYFEDISTATRFGFFQASTTLEADRSYLVKILFDDDVGVFDFVHFGTQLTLRQDRVSETTQGSHLYSIVSLQTAGDRTTNWTLTCTREKP